MLRFVDITEYMGMIASAMTWVPDGESVDDMSICDDS
jgi:hypothetical protein